MELGKPRKEKTLMSEENKALARRSWEFLDYPDILDEVYAADLVWHEPDQDLKGYEEARQFVSMYKAAFPDLNATVEDTIGEGDKVVTRSPVSSKKERNCFMEPTARTMSGLWL
jgi:predicted ester cyclase